MVDDDELPRAEELVGDDEGADASLAGPAAGVADHMHIALFEAEELGWDEPRIHAGDNGGVARRGHRQGALGKGGSIAFIGLYSFFCERHQTPLRDSVLPESLSS